MPIPTIALPVEIYWSLVDVAARVERADRAQQARRDYPEELHRPRSLTVRCDPTAHCAPCARRGRFQMAAAWLINGEPFCDACFRGRDMQSLASWTEGGRPALPAAEKAARQRRVVAAYLAGVPPPLIKRTRAGHNLYEILREAGVSPHHPRRVNGKENQEARAEARNDGQFRSL